MFGNISRISLTGTGSSVAVLDDSSSTRGYLFLQNLSETDSLYFEFAANAVENASFRLGPLSAADFDPTRFMPIGSLNILAASGEPFIVRYY